MIVSYGREWQRGGTLSTLQHPNSGQFIRNVDSSLAERATYEHTGVRILRQLLTARCVELLQGAVEEQFRPSDHTKEFIPGFDRFSNQFLSRTPWFKSFIAEFTSTLGAITGSDVVLTQAMILEMKQGSPGFLWHFDEFSFSFVRAEDMACTLWIPLTPIVTKEQHGGLLWVKQSDFSAKSRMQQWAYHQKKGLQLEEPENTYAVTKKAQYGDSWAGPYDVAMLEDLKQDCDMAVGDALLFNRYTWHKTHEILPGPIQCRTAVVLRVVSADARFDRQLFEQTMALRSKVKLPPSFGHLLMDFDDGIPIRDAVAAGASL